METRSAKRKKLLHAQYESSEIGEDRITDLPDGVLHHILFLLPIRFVAQTSLLSKRWRHIWYSFPDLDFTTVKPIEKPEKSCTTSIYSTSCHNNKGMDYISQVLSLRGKNSYIRILRLDATLSFSQLNVLMRSAVRHDVQEIDIKVYTNDSFNFPRCILISNSLKVFKLKSRNLGFRLPPSSIMRDGFQSLHTLSLSVVSLYQQEGYLLDLFTDSSFPLLRKLELDCCFGLKKLSVSCRTLVEFTLENCFDLVSLDVCCPKLEEVRVSSCLNAYNSNACVKIDAPKLRHIIWNDNSVTDHISLDNLTSLQEASVDFVVDKGMITKKLQGISNFLSGLSHSQCLILERKFVEILSTNNQFAGAILQPFVNLKSLELRTANIPVLRSLLRSSLSLHTLIIKIITNYKLQRNSNQRNRDLRGLSCLEEEQYYSESLKVVKIHGISECKDEISLVKFLLRYARVLQEMVIICSEHANSRGSVRLERIKSQVMGFSPASSDVKIVVQ